jgi:hypothetical protein
VSVESVHRRSRLTRVHALRQVTADGRLSTIEFCRLLADDDPMWLQVRLPAAAFFFALEAPPLGWASSRYSNLPFASQDDPAGDPPDSPAWHAAVAQSAQEAKLRELSPFGTRGACE